MQKILLVEDDPALSPRIRYNYFRKMVGAESPTAYLMPEINFNY